jgi:hypothetical protein
MAAPTHMLVLGASRGGTTLLATALGAHPQIACLDQDLTCAHHLLVGGKIRGVKLCVPNHVELTRRWNPLFTPGLWFGTTRKSLLMNRQPKCRFSIADMTRLGDTQHVGIVRDPNAVIGAIRRRENRSLRVAAYRYRRCLEVLDALDEIAARPPVLVAFDRLVQAPEAALRGLCAALEVPFDPTMLEAPAVNRRYPGDAFDASRAGPAGHADLEVGRLLPPDTLELYRRLAARSV